MSAQIAGDPDRRTFLKLAGGVGAAAVAGGALTACATPSTPADSAAGVKSAANPLGVKPDAPLDVVIFKGGYGDQYAIEHQALYKKTYAQAEIKHTGAQGLDKLLQPRFVGGNPPDVIDAQGLDLATLAGNGQLADLTPLLDAPSLDDPAKKVRETLLPGVVEAGVYGSTPYVLRYVYTVNGIWRSKSLFDKNGWQTPKTWDEMLALCATIKKAGIAPWTYPGNSVDYMFGPLLALAAKAAGNELLKNIDLLQPNAWKAPEILAAVTAIHELQAKGYLLQGSSGLTHTQVQTYWAQGKAAFYPCGSWLESELGTITPAGFDMVVSPVPSLSTADKLPYEAIFASPGETFVVPQQAKNLAGGLEYIRIMLSKQGAEIFSQKTKALAVVSGYANGITGSTAFTSAGEVTAAAGANILSRKFPAWYPTLMKAVKDNLGLLLTGDVTPQEWVNRVQKTADDVAADSSIKKYTY